MLERKPTMDELLIIRSLIMVFVDNDLDAEAVAEDCGLSIEDVQDFMRVAL